MFRFGSGYVQVMFRYPAKENPNSDTGALSMGVSQGFFSCINISQSSSVIYFSSLSFRITLYSVCPWLPIWRDVEFTTQQLQTITKAGCLTVDTFCCFSHLLVFFFDELEK